ncbi:hypothetical protein PCANC_01925 [Puccinia coronata f. sp. avenae]|uniref:Trafficking protein particle complex subunit 11 domain-containing protein n=1 Tax=Puccinia coronata f. sp. avenae TaxID=200324 RepID=A0A2N5VP93_9BASI|nr:hypothetical protein PCASD_00826 [Puccinia coronata f. sp. avenae]PLW57113.1 hypothetical protein PCANC_01925 [Puccinia coronata f. sp. avenae]
MDTLPNEFLSHHQPLMFFAGIEPQSTTPAAEEQAKNPPKNPFEGLIQSLRAVLASKPSHPSIWIPRQTPQPTPDYRVLLVSKSIRFPPRKTRPSSISITTSTNAVSHSPLSPLSQTSPLFPDGIMTPIWIRKHRDMIPSVFVLTLKLWEPSQPPTQQTKPDEYQHDRPEYEQFDNELIYEIIERKKTTSERGIKLAVIILTSRYMLDNPQLDTRLSYIRKKSSLDTRASLFVLSPVPPHDVVNFVHTLKAELYESTIDYYREHSRRVRRKRSRSTSNAFAQSSSYHQPGQPVITPLSPQGWSVRSDYKLATFAEFRQEYEVAIKSYEDCWEGLLQMFNSTAVLPPRTKRWAEAKVLVDCINFKISKLYLYSNEPTRAMYQFNKHIHKFRELCNGWGIGDETYEFWAWLSKQYTVLADLVDMGCRNGMRLPNLCPPPILASEKARTSLPIMSDSRLLGSGAVNLTGVLVHPGFYYFYGAQCAVERRNKFQASDAAEEEMRSIAQSKGEPSSFQPSIALVHERKINHGELIISLYTKAYEIFKTVGSSRMTLFLALKIALVHYHQNDHMTAWKFFDRIIPSYRKGSFDTLLDSVLYLSYRALDALVAKTKDTPNPEAGPAVNEATELLKIGLELLGKEIPTLPNDSCHDICTSLTSWIRPNPELQPSEAELMTLPVVPSVFPVQSQVAFWEPSIQLGEEVEFQVLLRIPKTFADCQPTIAQLGLKFTSLPVLTIIHEASQSRLPAQTLDVGILSDESSSHQLNLQVTDKSHWLITGRIKPSAINQITLEQVFFRFDRIFDRHHFEFVLTPANQALNRPLWIERFEDTSNEPVFLHTESFESMCKVQHRKPQVSFSLECEPCGIVNKRQQVHIEICNQEQESLSLKLLVKLQSTSADDHLEMDDQVHRISQTSTLKLGSIQPGETLKKVMSLVPTRLIGLRVLDLNLVIKATVDHRKTEENSEEKEDKGGGDDDDDDGDDDLKLESLKVFRINREAYVDVGDPIQIHSKIQSFPQPHHPTHLSYFKPFKPLHRLNLNILISNFSLQTHPSFVCMLNSVKIQSVSLSLENASSPSRTISCSLPNNSSSDLDIDLKIGDSFAISYIVEIELDSLQQKVAGCSFEVIWVCSSLDGIQESHSKQIPIEMNMPIVAPITVLTNLKPHLKLMEPVKVDYTIENRDATKTADVFVKLVEQPSTSSKRESSASEWLISGPKLMNSILVLPRSSKTISLLAVPTKLGQISGPKMEFFQRVMNPRHAAMGMMSPSTRSPPDRQQQPTLSSLKDLQELESGAYDASGPLDHADADSSRFDGLRSPALSHSHSHSHLVPIDVFRSHTVVVEKLAITGRDPSLIDDHQSAQSQNRLSRNLDHALKVVVLPA